MNNEHDVDRRAFMQRSAVAAAVLAASDAASGAEETPAAALSELARIQEMLKGQAPVTWIFMGDSITHGALHTLGWRSYPEHFAERVRWELRRFRDVVINTGISGQRTGGLLSDFEWQALRFKPSVVSIMIGMNDAGAGEGGRMTFRDNLAALVRETRDAGALPLLNTPNTVYIKNAGGREDLPAYAQIVRDVATETKSPLVDHWTHWQEAKPDQEVLLPWLEDKSIHPGVYGHREFAKQIFRELAIFDPASPTCALEVP